MVDVTGRELAIGQKVAFNHSTDSSLEVGTVVRFTPKKVVVEYTTGKRTIQPQKYPEELCICE